MPGPIDYYWGRPLWADVMPFQEDRGLQDVPNLLSKRNRGSRSMDGTAAFLFLLEMEGECDGVVMLSPTVHCCVFRHGTYFL